MSQLVQVILSGGVGSRLWPLSTKALPKQYLPLFENRSLLELCVERNVEIIDRTLIVCNDDHFSHCKKLLTNYHHINYLLETEARNTAAAIAFAAFSSEKEDVLFITPADHIIQDANAYEEAVHQAKQLALNGSLVTFGIQPDYPETGYGYIEYEGNIVVKFTEKPDKQLAEQFFSSENYLWNSGMFCFCADTYLQELKKFEPEIYKYSEIAVTRATKGRMNIEASKKIPSKSIDYAVMEQSSEIAVVPSDFYWSDLGSFESLYDYLIKKGQPVDENGNIVISDSKDNIPAFFLGLEHTILVHTKKAILILQKNQSQNVKKLYQLLEQNNSSLL